MPGTLTFVDTKLRTIRRLEFDWLSDSAGDVSGTTSPVVSGIIERIVTIPDGGGTVPTALYDVVLNDDGKPITSPRILAMIESRKVALEGLCFPFLSNKISGSREPTKTQWLLKYFVYRTAMPNPMDEECKDYYQRINIDSSDDINRFRGALLGGAIGDALGTALEFKAPGTFSPIDDIVGGGRRR